MRYDLITRFNREVEEAQKARGFSIYLLTAAAMVTALITSGLAPPLVSYVPRLVLEPLLTLFLRWDIWRPTEAYPLLELVPTMRYDFKVVSSMQDRFSTFGSVASDVLLLSCEKSPTYLHESSIHLAKIITKSQRIVFKELDHSSAWNSGDPQTVAATLRSFYKS